MTITLLLVFLIAFIIPILYQRTHFLLAEKDFLTTPLRTKTGLQIHHGHWGIVWIFIASMWMLFGDRNFMSVALLGVGWGLLCDEIIPSLKMPSKDRVLELEIYRKGTRPTLILALMVIVFLSIVFFLTESN